MRLPNVPGTLYLGCLLGVLLPLSLAGCSYWSHPTKPAAAFTADASVCQQESLRASTTYDSFDVTRHNTYMACLRARGWTLQD